MSLFRQAERCTVLTSPSVPVLATLALLASAASHVTIHVASKRSVDRLAFTWWMWVCGCVVFGALAGT